MIRTLRVRLTNPALRLDLPRRWFGPMRKEVITGDQIFEVPSNSQWRRYIKDGTLQLVLDDPEKKPKRSKSRAEPKPKADEESE